MRIHDSKQNVAGRFFIQSMSVAFLLIGQELNKSFCPRLPRTATNM
jgi:hypothetical protein